MNSRKYILFLMMLSGIVFAADTSTNKPKLTYDDYYRKSLVENALLKPLVGIATGFCGIVPIGWYYYSHQTTHYYEPSRRWLSDPYLQRKYENKFEEEWKQKCDQELAEYKASRDVDALLPGASIIRTGLFLYKHGTNYGLNVPALVRLVRKYR